MKIWSISQYPLENEILTWLLFDYTNDAQCNGKLCWSFVLANEMTIVHSIGQRFHLINNHYTPQLIWLIADMDASSQQKFRELGTAALVPIASNETVHSPANSDLWSEIKRSMAQCKHMLPLLKFMIFCNEFTESSWSHDMVGSGRKDYVTVFYSRRKSGMHAIHI